ncbi:MAG: holo-ACP synthase, partial [Chloroflexota bacterium]
MTEAPPSVGVDIIEIERVGRLVARHGEHFLNRVYTPEEVGYCRGRLPALAARFAAKEAVFKALGTGVRGVGWREVEVLSDRQGKPHVALHGRAQARSKELGLTHFAISLSHSRGYAVA